MIRCRVSLASRPVWGWVTVFAVALHFTSLHFTFVDKVKPGLRRRLQVLYGTSIMILLLDSYCTSCLCMYAMR